MSETLTPFHLQAEDVGTFLDEDRARDVEHQHDEPDTDGPSENAD